MHFSIQTFNFEQIYQQAKHICPHSFPGIYFYDNDIKNIYHIHIGTKVKGKIHTKKKNSLTPAKKDKFTLNLLGSYNILSTFDHISELEIQKEEKNLTKSFRYMFYIKL